MTKEEMAEAWCNKKDRAGTEMRYSRPEQIFLAGFDAGYAQAKTEAQGEIEALKTERAYDKLNILKQKSQLAEERARGEKLVKALNGVEIFAPMHFDYLPTSVGENNPRRCAIIANGIIGSYAKAILANLEGGSK